MTKRDSDCPDCGAELNWKPGGEAECPDCDWTGVRCPTCGGFGRGEETLAPGQMHCPMPKEMCRTVTFWGGE